MEDLNEIRVFLPVGDFARKAGDIFSFQYVHLATLDVCVTSPHSLTIFISFAVLYVSFPLSSIFFSTDWQCSSNCCKLSMTVSSIRNRAVIKIQALVTLFPNSIRLHTVQTSRYNKPSPEYTTVSTLDLTCWEIAVASNHLVWSQKVSMPSSLFRLSMAWQSGSQTHKQRMISWRRPPFLKVLLLLRRRRLVKQWH